MKLTECYKQKISCCCYVEDPRATAPLAGESKAFENQSSNLVKLSLQLENRKQKSRAASPAAGEAEEESSCYFPFLLCWRV
jgi:hypothetical protein